MAEEEAQTIEQIRVALATGSAEWHDAIYEHLRANSQYHIILVGWYTRLPLLMDALKRERPDVVLVDADLPGLSRRTVETVLVARGATCVALSTRGTGAASGLRDMGFVDVQTPPFDDDQFILKIQMARIKAEQLRHPAGNLVVREVRDRLQIIRDRIIVFYSRAGGVGKSTMARETAATLALIGHHPSVLVDFCATGSIQFRLFPFTQQDRVKNLFRLCVNASVDTGDPALTELIRQNLLIYRRHSSHEGELNLLFAPPVDEQWIDDHLGRPELFGRILDALARMYTFVIVDIGQDLNLPSHAAALRKADLIVVVTTPSPQTVEMVAESLADLEKVAQGEKKVRFVANKLEAGVGLTVGQIRELLGNLPQLGEIPLATSEVEASRVERRPAVLSERGTPFTVAMAEMVRKLGPLPEVFVPQSKRFALFRRG
ncbi:MAG: AAA family ATPase [Chloroflexi bacterium]|nr:AAA family ATPase [Chloroflexota bacterium]